MSRNYFPGMGQAVADRTINRKGESWGDVATRVALGNAKLAKGFLNEFESMRHHLSQASTLMSGRHLQHGDENQPSRPQEVFTNCSTAIFRFLTFKLLLSGSGVGSSYDDDLMVVDWNMMPNVHIVIDHDHPDVVNGRIDKEKFSSFAKVGILAGNMHRFIVPDTREGWAKAVELVERMTFDKKRNDHLVLDFSRVREFGRPIKGMQNRPASGPGPLMEALYNVAQLRDMGFAPWKAAMYADHYLAECVLVGGARRAARIAVKYWKDASIFEFIDIKRPDDFKGKTHAEVVALRKKGQYFSNLWSSNNSVAVDAEFWEQLKIRGSHAHRVFEAVMAANHGDGTGEPGFLNVDKLTAKGNIEQYRDGNFAESALYKVDDETKPMMVLVANRVVDHAYHYIVNPCGEIVLFILGGFCVIADIVPFHAANDDDAEDAVRTSVRALMRVNTMDSIYKREVERTNRIGVGLTGLHEYMWSRFGLSFLDALEEGDTIIAPGLRGPSEKALPFWKMLKRFSDAAEDEVHSYAEKLGVAVPHTWMTMKPAGTTSKLFGLTEGAHLPSMRKLLRWVQFRNDDPLVQQYKDKGYPTRELKSYSGTTIVGFPTAPVITTLGMGDKLMVANEATPAQQFRWLRLLEHYWLQYNGANQISYTLKYRPELVDFDEFKWMMTENVRTVRAVSVLPYEENLSYEYQPEEPISDERFDAIVAGITDVMVEDVDRVHVECDSGGCPIDFEKEAA